MFFVYQVTFCVFNHKLFESGLHAVRLANLRLMQYIPTTFDVVWHMNRLNFHLESSMHKGGDFISPSPKGRFFASGYSVLIVACSLC